MASYRGHAIGALLMFLPLGLWCAAIRWSIPSLLVAFLAMMVGAFFPDIDTASRGRTLFLLLIFMAAVFCIFTGRYVTALVIALSGLFLVVGVRHRGIFHNLYFLLLLTGLGLLFGYHWFPGQLRILLVGGAFLAYGCWSHLVFDVGLRRSFWWR